MKEIKWSWLLISGFIGIILGTVFANGMEHIKPNELTVFAVDQYSVSALALQERSQLSAYLLRHRGGQFLLLFGIGILCNSSLLVLMITGFSGFLWGLILSLETMRLGLNGLFLAVSCFLPQGICYLFAIWLFLLGKDHLRQESHVAVGAVCKWLLLPVLMAGLGILLEIWISPNIIQWLLQS